MIDAITDARWECSEARVERTFRVPRAGDGRPWDRIVLQVESIQTGDPWDRLLVASIGGAEVLRATTPRARMTLRKDVTEYAALMPQDTDVVAGLSIGSYVGSIEGRLRLEFYANDPTAALVRPAAATVHAAMLTRHIRNAPINPPIATASVPFGPTPPQRATIDVTTSGHGSEEFWFQYGPLVNVQEQRSGKTREFTISVMTSRSAPSLRCPTSMRCSASAMRTRTRRVSARETPPRATCSIR